MKTIGIVSLSAGTLGEPFVAHELAIGTKRLESMGCKVKFLPNALKGIAYLKAHPEKRAQDSAGGLPGPRNRYDSSAPSAGMIPTGCCPTCLERTN